MPQNPARVGPYLCGDGQPLLWIAGPCVLETLPQALEIAHELKRIAGNLSVQLVFKASFDKANRTSVAGGRGLGMDEGLRVLEKVAAATGLPVSVSRPASSTSNSATSCPTCATRAMTSHGNSRRASLFES